MGPIHLFEPFFQRQSLISDSVQLTQCFISTAQGDQQFLFVFFWSFHISTCCGNDQSHILQSWLSTENSSAQKTKHQTALCCSHCVDIPCSVHLRKILFFNTVNNTVWTCVSPHSVSNPYIMRTCSLPE